MVISKWKLLGLFLKRAVTDRHWAAILSLPICWPEALKQIAVTQSKLANPKLKYAPGFEDEHTGGALWLLKWAFALKAGWAVLWGAVFFGMCQSVRPGPDLAVIGSLLALFLWAVQQGHGEVRWRELAEVFDPAEDDVLSAVPVADWVAYAADAAQVLDQHGEAHGYSWHFAATLPKIASEVHSGNREATIRRLKDLVWRAHQSVEASFLYCPAPSGTTDREFQRKVDEERKSELQAANTLWKDWQEQASRATVSQERELRIEQRIQLMTGGDAR